MREINLNGYIDDDVWFGDEITPEGLHSILYEPGSDPAEDVHIRLNSYGGSCNAAVRMHDDLAAYPGRVSITISGTAASAATVLVMAADRLEMTPGSLFMIHDPIVGVIGNEGDLMDAVRLLKACKESIINVYATRTMIGRDQIAGMMRETTWLDAETALSYGFVDGITQAGQTGTIVNCAVERDVAEKRVQLWVDRHRQMPIAGPKPAQSAVNISKEETPDEQPDLQPVQACETEKAQAAETAHAAPAQEAAVSGPAGTAAGIGESIVRGSPPESELPAQAGAFTPISQLRKRLALIMPDGARQ